MTTKNLLPRQLPVHRPRRRRKFGQPVEDKHIEPHPVVVVRDEIVRMIVEGDVAPITAKDGREGTIITGRSA